MALWDSLKNWLGFGSVAPQERGLRDVIEEKLRAGPHSVNFPLFLPFYDETQSIHETAEHRNRYRRMIADPNVKAPLFNQILSVCGVDLTFNPFKKKAWKGPGAKFAPRDEEICGFISWMFKERCQEGVAGLAWDILSGGMVDGFSVNEKVWGIEEGGEWDKKYVLRRLKAKDVNNDLVLLVDDYRNITGIQGLRWNSNVVFDPQDFIIYTHMGWYENPTGMSALRAAYGRYWMLDTVTKLRGAGADKRAFPVIVGEYSDPTKQNKLEEALAKVKSSVWLAVPADVKVQALNIAGSADDYFRAFCADLREEIVLSIQGATLQAMAGREGQQRGDTKTHKDTADLWKWHLQQSLLHVFNNHESGLIKHAVDLNYAEVAGYPRASMGGIDDAELGESLAIDEGLKRMGYEEEAEAISERYGRKLHRVEQALPDAGDDDAGGGDDDMEEFSEDFDPIKHPRDKGKFAKKAGDSDSKKKSGLSQLAVLGKSAMHQVGHAEHVAKDFITKQVDKLPPKMKSIVVGGYKAIMATYEMAWKAVGAVAKERGATEEEAQRVVNTCATVDVLVGAKGVPVALASVGLGGLSFPAGFVPWGSIGYLAWSTAKDPLATLRAAKKKVASVIDNTINAAGAYFVEKELIGELLDRYATYEQQGELDWYQALLGVALDRTKNLEQAISYADQAFSEDEGLEEFAEAVDPWTAYKGPRGGDGWKHATTGKIIYGDKPGVRKKAKAEEKQPKETLKVEPKAKPAKKPEPKKADKPTPTDVSASIRDYIKLDAPDLAKAKVLIEQLGQLTVAEINQVKKQLGVKASGVKADLAKKIVTQAKEQLQEKQRQEEEKVKKAEEKKKKEAEKQKKAEEKQKEKERKAEEKQKKAEEKLKEKERKAEEKQKKAEEKQKTKPAKSKEPKATAAKQPHEMTTAEYVKASGARKQADKVQKMTEHAQLVAQAYREGKDLPDAVREEHATSLANIDLENGGKQSEKKAPTPEAQGKDQAESQSPTEPATPNSAAAKELGLNDKVLWKLNHLKIDIDQQHAEQLPGKIFTKRELLDMHEEDRPGLTDDKTFNYSTAGSLKDAVYSDPPPSRITTKNNSERIKQEIGHLSKGQRVDIVGLRDNFPEMSRREFDEAVLELWRQQPEKYKLIGINDYRHYQADELRKTVNGVNEQFGHIEVNGDGPEGDNKFTRGATDRKRKEHLAARQASAAKTPQEQKRQIASSIMNNLGKSYNYFSLVDLKKELPDMSKADLHAHIQDLRRRGVITLAAHEGRNNTLTDEELSWGIQEGDTNLMHIKVLPGQEHTLQGMVATEKPAEKPEPKKPEPKKPEPQKTTLTSKERESLQKEIAEHQKKTGKVPVHLKIKAAEHLAWQAKEVGANYHQIEKIENDIGGANNEIVLREKWIVKLREKINRAKDAGSRSEAAKERDEYINANITLRTRFSKELKQIKELTENERKAAMERLTVPQENRGKLQYVKSAALLRSGDFFDDKDVEEFGKAKDFIESVLSTTANSPMIPAIKLEPMRGLRACYKPQEHKISWSHGSGVKSEVFVHELGHALEEHLPGVKKLANEFLEYRTKDEKPVQMKKQFPGSSFDDDEYGKKDNFDKVFPLHLAYYCGKTYPEADNATELVSMGIEQLYKDPAKFASKDPEYFSFICGILDGSLR